MKKILCLTDGFTLGGAERQLIGLANLLKAKGYIVELACYHEKNFYKDLIEKYRLECITLQSKGRISKILAVRKLINEKKYDVVIAYKDGATMIASILKMLGMKAKLIVSERNTTQELTRREKIKFWLYKFSDIIVPNSYSQENFIKSNYPLYKNKIVTITNFTDTNFFSETISNTKKEILNVTIAGRIAEQKNIIRFLDVVKKLKDKKIPIHFQWFGNVSAGEEFYDKAVKQKLCDLDLKGLIDFLPATNDIKKEYQKCDVFCLPSLYEGYPNVICEAMSCGKPILCSRVCDNLFIVEEGKNGFMFDPLNEYEMVKVFERIASLDFEKLLCMGKESRNISKLKFSEEVFVKKYIQLIEY